MLVNLSELLTGEGKVEHYTPDTEMRQLQAPDGVYEIVGQESISLRVINVGDRTSVLEGEASPSPMIPCDRCLEPVRNDLHLTIGQTLDMRSTEEEKLGSLDGQPYLKGCNLDVDQLICDELLLNLPMKVLCDEDCKRICNRYGASLDRETCECDRSSLDLRMSVIQDVSKQFKEV